MRDDAKSFLESSKKRFDPSKYERTSNNISNKLKEASREYINNSAEKIMEERRLQQLNNQLSSVYLLS